jgi:hypothetical protein
MAHEKKHHVDFVATKIVKEPSEAAFTTRTGKPVDFIARKPVQEKVEISFMASKQEEVRERRTGYAH